MAELGVQNTDALNKSVGDALGCRKRLGRVVQTGFDAMTGQPIYKESRFDFALFPTSSLWRKNWQT
jgi:hypothetical protein